MKTQAARFESESWKVTNWTGVRLWTLRSVSHIGGTDMPRVVTADISVWGKARTLISVRLDVHHGRACICDFSRSYVMDFYVFGRRLLGACHPPSTLAIGGIDYFHLEGIPSSQVGHTTTVLPPGEWQHSITRLNRRREKQTLHLLSTTVDRDEDLLYNCAVRCCSSP